MLCESSYVCMVHQFQRQCGVWLFHFVHVVSSCRETNKRVACTDVWHELCKPSEMRSYLPCKASGNVGLDIAWVHPCCSRVMNCCREHVALVLTQLSTCKLGACDTSSDPPTKRAYLSVPTRWHVLGACTMKEVAWLGRIHAWPVSVSVSRHQALPFRSECASTTSLMDISFSRGVGVATLSGRHDPPHIG